MSNCMMPQGHPTHCGCERPDAFEVARHSKRLVEQLREQLSAVTAERDALAARLGEWERSKLAQIMRENVELTAERDRLLHSQQVLMQSRNAHRDERDQLRAEVEALRPDALIGTDAYRATVYVLRRAACDEVFGVAKLQRIFLLDWQSAERLLNEMVRRGDVEQCAGHGWKFPYAAAKDA